MPEAPPRAAARKHMPDRINIASIGMGALGVAGAILLAMVVTFALTRLDDYHAASASLARGALPVAGSVTLQPAPEQDIAAYRAEKRRQLEEYAWVDREKSIVSIPIEQSMALLAREAKEAQSR